MSGAYAIPFRVTLAAFPAAAALVLLCISAYGAAPHLEYTSVPVLDSFADLTGRVHDVDYEDHRVAVYIRVGGGWWSKPTFAEPLSLIVCVVMVSSLEPITRSAVKELTV